MSDEPLDEWVTVRTCVWGHQADLVRSLLEGSGMEVFVPDEHVATLRPNLLLGTDGVRVQVRASDVDRALEILNELEREQ
jgi:hypothetical protein